MPIKSTKDPMDYGPFLNVKNEETPERTPTKAEPHWCELREDKIIKRNVEIINLDLIKKIEESIKKNNDPVILSPFSNKN